MINKYMREIKFRAWDKENKIFIPCYKGLFIEVLERDGFHRAVCKFDNENLNEYAKNIIVMQYTGLKDKNRKEIYEGDIIKAKYHPCEDNETEMTIESDCVELTLEIVFRDGSFWAIAKHYQLLLTMFEEMEVINNIYENKDLFCKE